MSAETPTKGGAKGWTDAEKSALLWSIVQSQGTIDWKKVELPNGRTQKACLHVIEKLRKAAKEYSEGGSAPTTPTKPATAANKRKKSAKAKDNEDQEDDEEEVDAKSQAKRGKKANLVVKTDPVAKEEPEDDE